MVNTIQINLNKILESILNDVSLRPHFKDYVDLKNPELITLMDIRDNKNKSIHLKLKRGKVSRSEVLEVITTKRRYGEILNELDYQKITTNKNGPGSMRIERTKKRKFDNSDSK